MSHTSSDAEGFHIILPSNVYSQQQNTPAKYRTQLANNICLDGPGDQWEVALREISFVNAIKTIDGREQVHICQKTINKAGISVATFSLEKYIIETTIRGKNYRVIDINQPNTSGIKRIIQHAEFSIDYHASARRFSLTITNDAVKAINMDAYTAYVLGFLENRQTTDIRAYTAEAGDGPFSAAAEKPTHLGVQGAQVIRVLIPDGKKRKNPRRPPSGREADILVLGLTSQPLKPLMFGVSYKKKPVDYQISKSISIPEGYYQTAKQLVSVLNEVIKDTHFTFSFNDKTNRVSFKSTSESSFLKLDNSLVGALGFGKTDILDKADMEANYPPDLRRGIYGLYIYTDLVAETNVGNSLVPLLRTVSFNSSGDVFGQTVCVNYDNPIYVPLNKRIIDSIEILIGDDAGELVPFVEGKTVLTLHFRRRNA